MFRRSLAGANLNPYELRSGDRLVLPAPYRPQLTEAPLAASVPASAVGPDGISASKICVSRVGG